MKVYIDREKVESLMKEHNIRFLTQLAEEAGTGRVMYLSRVLNNRVESLKIAYLLCDYFECRLDDVCSVDWGE